MTKNNEPLNECLCCGSKNLQTGIDMENCPLTDLYKKTERESLELNYYKCTLNVCKDCGHCQLKEAVDPEESYNEYIYNSKVTTGLNKSFEEYAKYISKTIRKKAKPITILDVGSNDGSFLIQCKKYISKDAINY